MEYRRHNTCPHVEGNIQEIKIGLLQLILSLTTRLTFLSIQREIRSRKTLQMDEILCSARCPRHPLEEQSWGRRNHEGWMPFAAVGHNPSYSRLPSEMETLISSRKSIKNMCRALGVREVPHAEHLYWSVLARAVALKKLLPELYLLNHKDWNFQ